VRQELVATRISNVADPANSQENHHFQITFKIIRQLKPDSKYFCPVRRSTHTFYTTHLDA
jgi:hypothetical protein